MTGCASSASIGSQDLANSLDPKMISNIGSGLVAFVTSAGVGAGRDLERAGAYKASSSHEVRARVVMQHGAPTVATDPIRGQPKDPTMPRQRNRFPS